ncbi:MAG: hypothetical protein HQ553_08250 [Chloroflexi bacterium]|nr:hypothetical protein [Chloroflexota bacterium]
MFDFEKEVKQLAKQEGIDIRRKRPSGIDRSRRRIVAVSEESYIFVLEYARKHHIYKQAAADKIMKAGIKNLFFKDSWAALAIHRFKKTIRPKNPHQENLSGEPE